jgi:hypothetical protein
MGVLKASLMIVIFTFGTLNHVADVVPLVAFLANP